MTTSVVTVVTCSSNNPVNTEHNETTHSTGMTHGYKSQLNYNMANVVRDTVT